MEKITVEDYGNVKIFGVPHIRKGEIVFYDLGLSWPDPSNVDGVFYKPGVLFFIINDISIYVEIKGRCDLWSIVVRMTDFRNYLYSYNVSTVLGTKDPMLVINDFIKRGFCDLGERLSIFDR